MLLNVSFSRLETSSYKWKLTYYILPLLLSSYISQTTLRKTKASLECINCERFHTGNELLAKQLKMLKEWSRYLTTSSDLVTESGSCFCYRWRSCPQRSQWYETLQKVKFTRKAQKLVHSHMPDGGHGCLLLLKEILLLPTFPCEIAYHWCTLTWNSLQRDFEKYSSQTLW